MRLFSCGGSSKLIFRWLWFLFVFADGNASASGMSFCNETCHNIWSIVWKVLPASACEAGDVFVCRIRHSLRWMLRASMIGRLHFWSQTLCSFLGCQRLWQMRVIASGCSLSYCRRLISLDQCVDSFAAWTVAKHCCRLIAPLFLQNMFQLRRYFVMSDINKNISSKITP